jgi:N-carbamoyl-L-amino-acid hydrolase
MVRVHPNSRNVIPGRVTFSIDLRNASDALCDAMDADIRAVAAKLSAESGLSDRDHAGQRLPGTALRCRLRSGRGRAAEKLGYSHMPAVSAAPGTTPSTWPAWHRPA